MTVLNASTCDSLRTSGCVSNTPYAQVGSGPVGIAVDQATDTIYVVNSNNNTVSVINGATCNAQHASGCSHIPPTVTTGSNPVDVQVDQATAGFPSNRGDFGCGDRGQHGLALLCPLPGGAGLWPDRSEAEPEQADQAEAGSGEYDRPQDTGLAEGWRGDAVAQGHA
ncbi:MAG: hypothetical protein WBQ71_01015, partial [Trebonia sp.]